MWNYRDSKIVLFNQLRAHGDASAWRWCLFLVHTVARCGTCFGLGKDEQRGEERAVFCNPTILSAFSLGREEKGRKEVSPSGSSEKEQSHICTKKSQTSSATIQFYISSITTSKHALKSLSSLSLMMSWAHSIAFRSLSVSWIIVWSNLTHETYILLDVCLLSCSSSHLLGGPAGEGTVLYSFTHRSISHLVLGLRPWVGADKYGHRGFLLIWP